jgi:hypothetical protein
MIFWGVGVMYSSEYDVCDVTLNVHTLDIDNEETRQK